MDPRRAVHAYGSVEHTQPGPIEGCLLCKLAAKDAEIAALRKRLGEARDFMRPKG